MLIFDENKAVSDINKYEFLYPIYAIIINFLVIWHHFDYFYVNKWPENPSKSMKKRSANLPISPFLELGSSIHLYLNINNCFQSIFMPIISRRKCTGDNSPGFELQSIVEAIFDRFLTKTLKFYQKWSKIDSIMHYSSKTGGLSPVDFLLEIMGIKIDWKKLFIFK